MLEDFLEYLSSPDSWELDLEMTSRLKHNKYRCIILKMAFKGQKGIVCLDDKDMPVSYEKAATKLKLKGIHDFVKKEHLTITVSIKSNIPEIIDFEMDIVKVLYDYFINGSRT